LVRRRDLEEMGRGMLFAIDVGNTHIHMGVFREAELLCHWDISNSRKRTADELGMLLMSLLSGAGIEGRKIREVAAACVVPPVCSVVEEAFRRYFGVEPLFVGPDTERKLLENFEDPREVGADRIANAVGGFHKYGGPLIVVDFGTATTFDAVAADGSYLGGAIAPGLAISVEALFDRTARLPRIKLCRPPKAVRESSRKWTSISHWRA
jgi:type III pantothenate kinase